MTKPITQSASDRAWEELTMFRRWEHDWSPLCDVCVWCKVTKYQVVNSQLPIPCVING